MSTKHGPPSYVKAMVIVALICAPVLSFAWSMVNGNYSKESPPVVFQRVVGQPVPPGVSNLRVSGRRYIIKHWVWMTFTASTEALQTLTKGKELLGSERAQLYLPRSQAATTMYERADKQAVGWQPPSSFPRKEVYLVGHFDEGIMWSGYMLVDKQTTTVYVHAGD